MPDTVIKVVIPDAAGKLRVIHPSARDGDDVLPMEIDSAMPHRNHACVDNDLRDLGGDVNSRRVGVESILVAQDQRRVEPVADVAEIRVVHSKQVPDKPLVSLVGDGPVDPVMMAVCIEGVRLKPACRSGGWDICP